MALLSVDEALGRILSDVTALAAERVAIEDADGRVLATPLAARLTQPPFDASAMDGYAVRAVDVADLPTQLTVVGQSAAGHPFTGTVGEGRAVRIFTGGVVPQGADAIVIQEDTARDGDLVTIHPCTIDAGHIRKRGFDFSQGDTLLAAGLRLGSRELSLAAAMGHGEIDVRRRPRIGVLSTGDELVPPGTMPGPGQIIASNHLGIASMLRRAGADVRFLGIARDERDDLYRRFDAAAGCDVLVTIGGASVGDHDLVGPVLQERGMSLDFWKIAMRPGKPLMFGRFDGMRVIGLPGNPVSSLICTRVFAIPLVTALLGRPQETLAPRLVPTTRDLGSNGPRQHYMRATMILGEDGHEMVTPARSQDSSLLSPLAAANVLIVRLANEAPVKAGADVPVIPLDF